MITEGIYLQFLYDSLQNGYAEWYSNDFSKEGETIHSVKIPALVYLLALLFYRLFMNEN